jgi:SpoIID/LytB domain protein
LNDNEGASEAYRRAVGSDSYFHEGRHPLTRTYLQLKRYKDAWRQLSRLAEAEPSARLTRAMMDKIRPLIVGQPTGTPASGRPNLIAPTVDSETQTALPMIRVGIATTPMGKPRPRQSVTVRGSGTWRAIDPKSKRLIANCGAQQAWTLRIITTKKKKSKNRLELRGPDGELRPVPGDSVYFESDDSARGSLSLEDDPVKGGPLAAGRAMRGSIEVSLFNQRRSLRLVNILNIEDYSQGVVGAEMPAVSPLEALKAQAIMARTHALYIKSVTKRHKKEGYDICDEQHCQVYAGIHLETPRTREAVTTTRGRVVNYKGSLAHVIYSSNCGGFTQSGSDIGWGAVPYWGRVSDSAPAAIPPATPMELRRYLSNWPDAYCRPSGHVHPSHSRWSRVISAKDLEERINRKKKIGTLKGLRVLRRAPTGNVEALLILGSRKNWKLHDEFDIRSLLGVGSLRSTLFIVDTEYRTVTSPAPKSKKNKQPAPIVTLVPDAFVFRGGGWGHAVGLCQSGAIGRASAGQGFEDIIRAYFPGVEMSQLKY